MIAVSFGSTIIHDIVYVVIRYQSTSSYLSHILSLPLSLFPYPFTPAPLIGRSLLFSLPSLSLFSHSTFFFMNNQWPIVTDSVFLIADDIIFDVDHTDSILLKRPTTATAKLIYGCLGQNRYKNSKPQKPIH